MGLLSKHLSSLRDDRNKTLKKFLSHYKLNNKWNIAEVNKSWNYILSITNKFESCESLFSDVLYGTTSLLLTKNGFNHEDSALNQLVFSENKDVDFLKSEELYDLNVKIRTFIYLSVPYFLIKEFEHLVDYLIYKYNIAVSLSELLMISYIQYNNSPYYCKLLSLINISNESCLYSLYNDLKSSSMKFTEHKYISSNVVFSGIVKNFSLYKQVSSCYDELSRMCTLNTNIVSFLNTVNFHYVICNYRVMENNEVRYVVSMVKKALVTFDDLEYVSSHLCLLITMVTHIQFTVIVQRELVSSLGCVLNNLKDLKSFKIDHLILFKYVLMSIYLMLQYQKVTLDKLPQDITNSLIDIIQKQESVMIVFDNLKTFKGLDFSKTINLMLNSLIKSTVGNVDARNYSFEDKNIKVRGMDRIEYFLNFVSGTFDFKCMKMIVFALIDELNGISSHVKSHGESIIAFDESRMVVNINKSTKLGSTLILLFNVFKSIKDINSTALECSLMDYLNELTYETLQDQFDTVMFIYRSVSEDVIFRIFMLLNRYSESKDDIGYRDESIKMKINMFSILNDKKETMYKDEKIYSSLLDFIASMYLKTDSHTTDFNIFVHNLIIKSMDDVVLSHRLESDERFWKSVPVQVSIGSLIQHIQSIIDKVDLKFKYNKSEGLVLDSVNYETLKEQGFKYIFGQYIRLILESNEIDRIFKEYKLVMKIHQENSQFDKYKTSVTLNGFVGFISLLYLSKNGSSSNNSDVDLKYINELKNEHKVDLSILIDINNEILSCLATRISRMNKGVVDDVGTDQNLAFDHSGYVEFSSKTTFSIFSALYYQYLTLDFISECEEDMELLHSQFVVIADMVLKYVKRNMDVANMVDFVEDFYKFTISKYDMVLCKKRNLFNPLMVIKRMETIHKNRELNKYYAKYIKESLTDNYDESSLNGVPETKISIKKRVKGRKETYKNKTDIEVNDVDCLNGGFGMNNNKENEKRCIKHISDSLELIRIINTNWNEPFTIRYYYDDDNKLIVSINEPLKYKHRYLNVDFIKLDKENNLSHMIEIKNFYKDSGLESTVCYGSIGIFENVNEQIVENVVEFILSVYRLKQNEYLLSFKFIDMLINVMELINNSSFKYSKRFVWLLSELSNLLKNKVVKQDILLIELNNDQKQKSGLALKHDVNVKYDLSRILSSLSLLSTKGIEVKDNLLMTIGDYLSNDKEFFHLFILNVFKSTNCVYNMDFYNKICSIISSCDHEIEVFYSLLENLYEWLSDKLNGGFDYELVFLSSFLDILNRYSLLLYCLSKSAKMADIKYLEKYVKQCSQMMRIYSEFRLLTQKYNKPVEHVNDGSVNNLIKTGELVINSSKSDFSGINQDYFSEINKIISHSIIFFEYITFVTLYGIDEGQIWSLASIVRNKIYFSFSIYYRDFNSMYLIKLIEKMFVFKEVDDKLVLGFMYSVLTNCYREDVVTYVINNIESLKTYEKLLYIIKKVETVNMGLKMNLIIKILSNVLISTDFGNGKVQSFVFTHLNGFINDFVKLLFDPKQINLYVELFDKKLENELKLLKNDNVFEKDCGLEFGNGRHEDEFKSEKTVDEDELLSLITVIVNVINCVFDNIYRLDVKKIKNISKLYNELYHNTCCLVNGSIDKFGVASFKLLKRLINNLMVCSTKLTFETSEKCLEESVNITVTSTINNIIGLNRNRCFEDIIGFLLDKNTISFIDESLYVTFVSYLMYMYFSLNANKRIRDKSENHERDRYYIITEFLNGSESRLKILSNLIWINQVMAFDPINKYGLKTSRFEGYDSVSVFGSDEKARGEINYELSNEIYMYLLGYVQSSRMFNVNVDLSLFNDMKSESHSKYLELNELIYSLLSSYVLFKDSDGFKTMNQIKSNKHFKSINSGIVEVSSENSNLIKNISEAIIGIFRLNQLGIFNIHVYGTLNSIFDNKLNEKLKSISDSENIWNKIECNGDNYYYYLKIVSSLMCINNQFVASIKNKDDALGFKYEKELENLQNLTSITLFDFFKHSEQIYVDDEREVLFNRISYMRSEVWKYFLINTPVSIDSFILILANSFSLILNHYKNGGNLLWSYLDMLFAMKIMIKMCMKGGGYNVKSGSEDDKMAAYKYKNETCKMLSTIEKFKEVSEVLLLGNNVLVEFVKKLFILFLLCSHKYFKSLLNVEYYEFSMNLILNYVSSTKSSNMVINDNEDEEALTQVFEEFLSLKTLDCIKEITDGSLINYKYFNTEWLIYYVTHYTSVNIDIKTLIRLVSKVYSPFKESKMPLFNKKGVLDGEKYDLDLVVGENLISKLSRLLRSLSYNIKNKTPKSKYVDDLNDVYFIVVNFYSMYSFEMVFGDSGMNSFKEYNSWYFRIDDKVSASKKLSTSLFTKNSVTDSLIVFESSFVSYVLNYFSLISSNKLLDLLEKQSKMFKKNKDIISKGEINSIIQYDLNNRIYFISILSSIYEYGSVGATNVIISRLYQNIEEICNHNVKEARLNYSSAESELSFNNTWTWFNNCRFVLQIIEKSIETWNVQRGVVPDVIVNSWVKLIKDFISVFDLIPINAELEVDNITTSWSKSLEKTVRALINGFITQDDKIVKIESCLSDQLPTKSLNVKIGSLVIMNNLWDDLGIHLSLTIKNIMPIIGELVDDENEIVRRLALKLDEKVKEVLYQD